MKRSFEELEGVDIALHARICLKYFQLVSKTSNSPTSDGVKESVSLIYEDASSLLKTLIEAGSLEIWSENLSNEQPSSSSNAQNQNGSSGLALVKDLILVTSFICSNSHEYHNQSIKQQTSVPSSSSSVVSSTGSVLGEFSRKNTVSPLSSLIAISPYWAIATLISQSKTDQAVMQKLRGACKTLLTGRFTSRAHVEISEEIIQCTNHLPLSFTKNVMINQLLARIRRSLRTHLKNVLLFAVVLSMSIHSELSLTLRRPMMGLNQAIIDQLLSASDDNCIDVVRMVVNSAPQLALQTDTGSVGATPLAYASAYRCSNGQDGKELEYKLALGLCKVLTDVAPSALAISDRLGMLPLHHAARKGHPCVLEFLSSHYFFTVPLRDSSGKTALHHALISFKQQGEESIIRLARLCPKILKEPSRAGIAFDPLDYAQKHCSEGLFMKLQEIYTHDRSCRINVGLNKLSLSNKRSASALLPSSPSCNLSTSTDPELSESEISNDDHPLDNDSLSSEDNHQDDHSTSYEYMMRSKDQDLLQYADTLLLLQAAKTTNLDLSDDVNTIKKRQRLY